jgi:predicted nucleic acid-binding Zn ribbon protein
MRAKRTLANEARILDSKLERFLLDLVNARVDEAGAGVAGTGDDAGRIFRLYSQFLPHLPSTTEEAYRSFMLLVVLKMRSKQPDSPLLQEGEAAYQRGIVAELRDQLRAVWTAEDADIALWRLSGLCSLAQEIMAGTAGPTPPTPDAPLSRPGTLALRALAADAPLSQALLYVWRRLGMLRKCPNPKCPNRFFVAVRKGQKCCSDQCASLKRREYKRAWWSRRRSGQGYGELPGGEPAADEDRVKERKVRGGHPGIAEADVKAFVLDVVNASDGKVDDASMYLFSRYPSFFPSRDRDIRASLSLTRRGPGMHGHPEGEFPQLYQRRLFKDLRDGLRNLWQAGDESTAAWMFFRLQSVVHSRIDVGKNWQKTLRPPSAHAPVHMALRWVRQHLKKLKKCGNGGCAHPYFVAAINQRFCSKECAHIGQKASKLRSWERHQRKHKWVKKPGKR